MIEAFMEVVRMSVGLTRKLVGFWGGPALVWKKKAYTWLEFSSVMKKLHPWLRNLVVEIAKAVLWTCFIISRIAISLLATSCVYFCAMFVLGPYLGVFFWLLSYFMPSLCKLSHPSFYTTSLVALSSVVFFCILSLVQGRLQSKDPRLDVGDYLTSSLAGLPKIPQVVLGYGLFSLGSACAAVLTLDIFLSIYWGFFGSFYFLYLFYLLVSRLPWFVMAPAIMILSIFLIRGFRRFKSLRKLRVDVEMQGDHHENKFRNSLTV